MLSAKICGFVFAYVKEVKEFPFSNRVRDGYLRIITIFIVL